MLVHISVPNSVGDFELEDLRHCLDYLQQQHVLTLCSAHADKLWAANCFYVLDREAIGFWLMTEPTSLHGCLMTASPRVVGTISDQIESIAELQGIQFQGHISLATEEQLSVGLPSYQRRFPIAKKKIAPLWFLRIDQLKMTDNRLGFGTKFHWQRAECPPAAS